MTALSNHKTHTKNQGLSTQHKFQPKHKRKVNEIENDKGKKSNKNQNRKQQTNYEFFTNHRVSAFFLRAVFSSLVISVVVLVTGIVNDAWLIDDVIVPSSIDRFSCSALKMCFFLQNIQCSINGLLCQAAKTNIQITDTHGEWHRKAKNNKTKENYQIKH